VAQTQPQPSENDPTVGGITPIASLAEAHHAGPPPGAVWLTMCAWCSRLKVRGRWVSAPTQTPYLLDASGTHTPLITHGICPTCFDQANADGEQYRRARDGQ
jgi:hypothetical protein